ncbi:MAG TPA: SDR family NAD(P)-dependent oxidoreductase [Steroidobacteraceae bacterium]|jgi:NAD(P)-dependent dehydrogenase (short-subunit alcohol dehydrogenase family)|nr:SDR family NAD(P)-dependent oxidoreductase [Steroidobacteraceae bacterium]
MKTFLSIGSGPGNGFATALRFAREGFHVTLSGRNPAKAQELAERLTAQGYAAEGRAVDAADPENVRALIASVQSTRGPIDVLHYNSASLRRATLAEQPWNTFDEDLAVNVGGALIAAQAVATQMSERRTGTILLTGGGYSLKPNPQFISLSIGKAGIRALALGMFESLKEQGIHIATVTIEVAVRPDSPGSEAVGELFWQLYSQPAGRWTAELKYSG